METATTYQERTGELELTSEAIANQVANYARPVSVMHEVADPSERDDFYESLAPQVLTRFEGQLPETAVFYEKDETAHPGGSYKLRGATRNLQLQLVDDESITEVHTVSTGNHGRGVAVACHDTDLRVVVHAPKDISPAKKEGLLESGAELSLADTFAEAKQEVAELAELPGVAVVEPYDDVRTMAGQATCGYEIVSDLLQAHSRGELDLMSDEVTVWVPGGGGGFGAGVAVALEDLRRSGVLGTNVAVKIAQMEGSDALARQYRGEAPLTPETLDKSCDATAVLAGGELTQTVIADKRFVADVVSVPKLYVARALEKLRAKHGRGVEPAGALSLAAALYAEDSRTGQSPVRRVHVTVTSGANVSRNTEHAFASLLTAENREEFERLSQEYANREVYGLEEVLARSAGKSALSPWCGPTAGMR